MNDFTKEELEDLLVWSDIYTEFRTCWTTKFHMPLINKIQSMIDNYCDHEKYQTEFIFKSVCCNCGDVKNDN
jgi:hypothetical protein